MLNKKPIMIMGCTSDSGKSFLVAALCRYFSDKGLRVAPFKAQNMSNNAAVTKEGLEIGRAQYLQCLAAREIPQARMNPVLLKPSADTYSQVIVMGKYDPMITKMPWMKRKSCLWPVVCKALNSLIADYDQVIIEGAGSPAEVNLRKGDIVNMSVALECGADVYLAVDIDRGGAFAHLLGTWMCLEPEEQKLIKGFVLNKFRGDQKLLGNAMDWLKSRTGVPTAAIIPMVPHHLPEEDTLRHRSQYKPGKINIAMIVYPYASNLDEFDPLVYESGVNVVPVRDFISLKNYNAIILPGSKNTAGSLRYLKKTGFDNEIKKAAQSGKSIFAVCGGMQMLGKHIYDPDNIESGDIKGLGILDMTTTLSPDKTTLQREVRWTSGGLVRGYEIHHGRTQTGPRVKIHLEKGLGWQENNILAVYLHGLFENTSYRQYFLEQLGWPGKAEDWHSRLDSQLELVSKVIKTSGWFSKK